MRRILVLIGLVLTACSSPSSHHNDFDIAPADIKSGYEFITPESQSLQNDAFSNPGYLWVEKGAELFKTSGCQDCHKSEDFRGSFESFPKIHAISKDLINLQGQVNYCQTERLRKQVPPYESEDMLGLVSFIKNQSLGLELEFTMTDDLRPHFEKGRDYFFQRRGQFNLSCVQCHDDNWGTKMRGDTVSQGHINGFPAFRNDWQTLGSTHRRFQACNEGVRAQTSELGSLEYLQLEVYLMARGSGLKTETPSIRR